MLGNLVGEGVIIKSNPLLEERVLECSGVSWCWEEGYCHCGKQERHRKREENEESG